MAIAYKQTRQITESFKSEDISSQITGTNNEFQIKPFQKGTLCVYWNGILQRVGNEITLLSSTQFRTSFVPETSDTLHVIYFRL